MSRNMTSVTEGQLSATLEQKGEMELMTDEYKLGKNHRGSVKTFSILCKAVFYSCSDNSNVVTKRCVLTR